MSVNPNSILDTSDKLAVLAKNSRAGQTHLYVAKHPDSTDQTLQTLAASNHEQTLIEIAQRPDLARHVTTLKTLLETTNKKVQQTLANNPNCSEQTLQKISEIKHWDIDKELTQNPACPEHILKKIFENNKQKHYIYILHNPNCPPNILAQGSGGEPNIQDIIAKNPNTPATTLQTLAQNSSWLVGVNVAENPSCDEKIVETLLKRPEREIHRQLAQNPRLSPAALTRLAAHRDATVRAEVAKNPNTPVDILKKLAAENNYEVAAKVAENPGAPVELLHTLATHQSTLVKLALAANQNINTETINILLSHQNPFVDHNLATNPRLNAEHTKQLATSHSLRTLENLAKNPACDTNTLNAILQKPINNNVRRAAAQNPNCDRQTALALSWNLLKETGTDHWQIDTLLDNIINQTNPEPVIAILNMSGQASAETNKETMQRLQQTIYNYINETFTLTTAQKLTLAKTAQDLHLKPVQPSENMPVALPVKKQSNKPTININF